MSKEYPKDVPYQSSRRGGILIRKNTTNNIKKKVAKKMRNKSPNYIQGRGSQGFPQFIKMEQGDNKIYSDSNLKKLKGKTYRETDYRDFE